MTTLISEKHVKTPHFGTYFKVNRLHALLCKDSDRSVNLDFRYLLEQGNRTFLVISAMKKMRQVKQSYSFCKVKHIFAYCFK